jgi:hypothetical protein
VQQTPSVVETSVDRDETEAASPFGLEFDERRTEQVDRIAIPQIHVDDSPATDKSCHHGKVRRGLTPTLVRHAPTRPSGRHGGAVLARYAPSL